VQTADSVVSLLFAESQRIHPSLFRCSWLVAHGSNVALQQLHHEMYFLKVAGLKDLCALTPMIAGSLGMAGGWFSLGASTIDSSFTSLPRKTMYS
jgi:hypothetical protein